MESCVYEGRSGAGRGGGASFLPAAIGVVDCGAPDPEGEPKNCAGSANQNSNVIAYSTFPYGHNKLHSDFSRPKKTLRIYVFVCYPNIINDWYVILPNIGYFGQYEYYSCF